ncbi:hypothetical protein [Gilvimarinus chinensis]|uniref:Nmad3 family putative nucleotide modification protein n=1 Tax=Gilvimarinus chinensis TaxID=396005 RepID=UPI000367BD50|nr:hypothetical protein [Gilvimarinus chinensis]
MPSFFYPSSDKPPLSYHSKPERWQKTNTQVTLQAAARGQEFVLDTHYYPDTAAWLVSLLRH